MRDRIFPIVVGILSLLAGATQPGPRANEIKADEWTHSAPVLLPPEQTGFVQLLLPPELIAQAQPAYADLRLVDGEGSEVPWLLLDNKSSVGSNWQPVPLLNREFEPGNFRRVTLDLRRCPPRRQLRVQLSGNNFRRRALLEASPDGKDWARVREDIYLLQISSHGKTYDANSIEFPVSNAPWMRLTVHHMPEEEDFSIQAVHYLESSGAREPGRQLPLDPAGVTLQQQSEEKRSLLTIDSGWEKLPVTRIQLDITDPYFYRPWRLEGRNADTVTRRRANEYGERVPIEIDAPWQSVASGVFYRIEGDKEFADTGIGPIHAPYRYLRIVIENADNPPLEIRPAATRIAWQAPRLLFDSRHAPDLRLLWGNTQARAPRYDLDRAVADLDEKELPEARLGPIHSRPPAPPPLSERLGPLPEILFGLVALALIAYFLRNLFRLRSGSA